MAAEGRKIRLFKEGLQNMEVISGASPLGGEQKRFWRGIGECLLKDGGLLSVCKLSEHPGGCRAAKPCPHQPGTAPSLGDVHISSGFLLGQDCAPGKGFLSSKPLHKAKNLGFVQKAPSRTTTFQSWSN